MSGKVVHLASVNVSSQQHLDESKDYSEAFENLLRKLKDEVSDEAFPQYAYLLDQIHDSNESDLIEKTPPGDLIGYLSLLRDDIFNYTTTGTNRIVCTNPNEDNDWSFPFSLINVVVPDYPFVVDSLVEWIGNEGYEIEHTIYHCVDETVFPGASGDPGAFFVSLLIERIGPEELRRLKGTVEAIVDDITAAVKDFDPMLDRIEAVEARLSSDVYVEREQNYEIETIKEFLDYLVRDHFVFLGSGHVPAGHDGSEPEMTQQLGLLKQDRYGPGELPIFRNDNTPRESGSIFSFDKTNLLSRVYRRDRLYCLTIDEYDDGGSLVGHDVFLGLLTNRVLTEPAVQLPVLKQTFEKIVDREGLAEHTHEYRDIYSIFNSMPKHLLFMTPLEDLIEDLNTIMDVKGERMFKIRTRPVPDHEGLTMMIIMEKEKFSGDIRKQIQTELEEEFEADHIDYRLSLGEGSMARLHFDIETSRLSPKSGSFEELEQKLFEFTRTWSDRLQETIFASVSDKSRRQQLVSLVERFPDDYRALVDPAVAYQDLENLETLHAGEKSSPLVDMSNVNPDTTHLMIYSTEKLTLNETLPILSNHGFTVVQQATFDIGIDGTTYHLHLFDVQNADGDPIDLTNRKSKLVRSIHKILVGTYRDDSLNQLILRENLPMEVLDLFRLYKNYFHQLSPAIKLESINRTLFEHSGLAKEFYNFFELKFDPSREVENRHEKLENRKDELQHDLQRIENRTPYQILRSLLNLIDSTVRTSFYQKPDDTPSPEASTDYISVKIECSNVDQMPEPRPLYEIFVYSSLMEAVHLRSGKIARGGIRWSDRRDDFRTEVLGLMKTQKVKNALIIPEGAKGGFVLKTEYLNDDKPLQEHAREQYEVFMHAMLDLTDNYRDGHLVTPPNLVIYDEKDPYHVVAADKGTATFSDTANAVAKRYDFWLGDAFASGGSVGYDHKELGITAKGGWECVKRHFRELGKDIQNEPFTVAGIGDMSGDVFGNGMILSDQIKLVAAFDHRNIFLDPAPDPADSFAERKRLFDMEDSSWEDYNTSLISDGGGVYDRNANLLELEPKAVEMLGLSTSEIAPDDLIREILQADVDLLWNGGIGTYIKSSSETHSEVGDPQNDAFRADADQVEASVIGEGGNLGITQKGRIELDRRGVKLNTDFIDNSGGVDLSDHEVNLKILLEESIKQDLIEREDRADVLQSQAEPIVDEVVRDNYEQSGIISLESCCSGDRLKDYRHLIQHLEETIDLNRSVEALPDEQELQDRIRAGESMTRPELAVLLSYTKMDLYNHARQEPWPEPTVIEPFIERYFPDPIVENHGPALTNHRLRKEIALTTLINYCVDSAGCVFFHRLEEELGAGLMKLIRSYLTADKLAGAESIRQQIFDLDNSVPASTQYQAWQSIVDNMAHSVSWLIDTINVSVLSEGFQTEMSRDLNDHFETILETLQPRQASFLNGNIERWNNEGFNQTLSEDLGKLPYLVPALEIILIHQDFEDIDVRELSELYFRLGKTLHIDWVIRQIFEQDAASRWDQFAFRTLGIELHELQRQLLQRLLERNQTLESFKEEHRDTLDRLDNVQRTLAQEQTDRYSAFQYMAQRMRSLL